MKTLDEALADNAQLRDALLPFAALGRIAIKRNYVEVRCKIQAAALRKAVAAVDSSGADGGPQ